MIEAATPSARSVYFDGVTSALHAVMVALTPTGVQIRNADDSLIAEWPYERLKHLNAPERIFRIGLRKSDKLERLEIEDPDIAHAIDLACPDIDRTGASARSERRKATLASFAAAAVLVLVAFYGIPQIADRLAPVMPQGIETRLGNAADSQVRKMFDNGPKDRPFECGGAPVEAAGKAAFDKLMARLEKGGAVRIPIQAIVVRRPEANAVTLPGGHIYVFQGLIDNAQDVDEVAGVIAHELGHAMNRDGVRTLLQAAGLSLVFGSFLGDFVGGGAVVFAAETLLKSAYSRHKEAAADDYAVRTMQTLNANPRALGSFLGRIAVSKSRGSIFLDHPPTPERVARINAIASPQSGGATLLDAAEWRALKRVCAGYP
ncbi:MAG: M48 family metallopeptidase [Pseudorhodoplanes sp.]